MNETDAQRVGGSGDTSNMRSTTAITPQQKLTRLSVNMNTDTTEKLRRVAYDKELSYTETVSRAIAIMAFLQAEVSEGRIIQVVDKGSNKFRELVLL